MTDWSNVLLVYHAEINRALIYIAVACNVEFKCHPKWFDVYRDLRKLNVFTEGGWEQWKQEEIKYITARFDNLITYIES